MTVKVKKIPGTFLKKAPAAFLGLGLAGFRLNFEADAAGIITVLASRYTRFLRSGKNGFVFDAKLVKGRQNPFKPVISCKGSRLEIKRGDFAALLDLRTGLGTLAAAATEQCLDAFLRSLISFMLIREGGFMLHSAGLVKNGKVYLFLGKSGAGKSTLSKLAAANGAEVISDEINLVRPVKGSYRVYGSPFWGEMRADGRPGSWPLGGLFLLKKAKANRVQPCSKPEALKLLLRCLLNFDKSPGAAERVIKNSFSLLGKARFAGLEFTRNNAGFLELI